MLLIFLPPALDVLYREGLTGVKWGVGSVVGLLGVEGVVNAWYYGHLVVPPALKIVSYNVFGAGGEGGPELYGVEDQVGQSEERSDG